LECRFLGKKGQFNLAQIEALGIAPELGQQRGDCDVLRLHFQHLSQVQDPRLNQVLADHLRGFREAFGKSSASARSTS
jgi:hypothetical protein